MDYYVKEFLTTNKLGIDVPFRVKETGKIVVVKEDGSFIDCATDMVLNLGEVFSILSGAYHVELDNVKCHVGDTYYYVYDINTIEKDTWEDSIYDYALLNMGNVFTTRFEADNHKEEILNKCRDINTREDAKEYTNKLDVSTLTANNGNVASSMNDTSTVGTKDIKTVKDVFRTSNLLNDAVNTATLINNNIKNGLSGMAMSIDKDSIESGKYKGYTLHNGVKKDFDINATSLGEAIREALKKSFK